MGPEWIVVGIIAVAVLFGASLIVSAGFLSYVRTTGENEEMGKTYATQLREGITPEEAK